VPILIDYRCTHCGGRSERWVDSPAPQAATCPACLGDARRVFGFGGIGGSARTATSAPSGSGPPKEGQPDRLDPNFVARHTGVPGICHMGPSAARRWAAMARKDTRAVEAEIAYQEKAVKDGTLSPSDAFVHSH